MSSNPHKRSAEIPLDESESALRPLSNTASDSDWHERVTLAKQAREFGKKARKGKPITFRMTRNLRFGDAPKTVNE